jgi:hypothetical protein
LYADFPDWPDEGYLENQANLRSIAFYGDILDYYFVNFLVVLFRLTICRTRPYCRNGRYDTPIPLDVHKINSKNIVSLWAA